MFTSAKRFAVAAGGLAAMLVAMFAQSASAQQFSNAYTRLNLGRCVGVDRPGAEGESLSAYRCKGFKNAREHDIYVFETDGRFYITYGRDAFERRAANQTLEPHNTIGDDLEWRMERRAGDWQPFALIARYFTEVEDEGGFYRGEVLVILKIGRGEACHAVYIDAQANANANRLAREAADTVVRQFDCARDAPIVHGERGRSLGPTS
jgi:hypothetical protein